MLRRRHGLPVTGTARRVDAAPSFPPAMGTARPPMASRNAKGGPQPVNPNQKALRAVADELDKIEARSAEIIAAGDIDEAGDKEIRELAAKKKTLIERRGALAVLIEADDANGTTAPDDGDPEKREAAKLAKRARLGAYITAALTGRNATGAEAELRAVHGVGDDSIPMALFDVPHREEVERRAREERATTPAPDTVGVNLGMVEPFVFAPSIAPMLGIEVRQVPSGTYAIPRVSTAPSTAAAKDKGAAADATAGALTVVSATPKRVPARLTLSLEDVAAVGTDSFESGLRQALQGQLSHSLDNQVINGDGQAPNLSGMFQQLDDATADAVTLTFDHGLGKLADLIDGLWATMTSHVVQCVGVDTYKLAAKAVSVPAEGGKGELTLADYLRLHSGGFHTNSRMPDAANMKQKALAYRMGRMGLTTAVIPSWGRIAIDDVYSDSDKGERHVTLSAIVGDLLIVQPGAYAEVEYKVA